MAFEDDLHLLPSDWSTTTLGELCDSGGGDIQTGPFGSQLHSADYVFVGVPSIMPTNILVEGIQAEGIARITPKDAERLQKYRVRDGDIVYSRRGDVEKCVLVTTKEDGWLCGTGCLRVRLGKAPVNPDFVHAYLSSPPVRAWVVRHSVGATMPNLNTGILRSLPLAVPPPEEMQGIGAVWTALIKKANQLASMNQTLEAMARAIFKSWFVDFDPVRAKAEGREPEGMDAATGLLFPSGFQDSKLGPIPVGWQVSNIGNCAQIGRGASPRPIQDYMNGEVPWIKIADATSGDGTFIFQTKERVKQAGVPKSVQVGPGDLVMSNSASCGIPVFIEIHGCIHDGWLYFRNYQSLTKQYLYFWLKHISARLVHVADGSVQKNLNTTLVSSQQVLIPPPNLMDHFDQIAIGLLAQMRHNIELSRTLRDLRDTLLPRLISGKLRVPEAEKMVEAVL